MFGAVLRLPLFVQLFILRVYEVRIDIFLIKLSSENTLFPFIFILFLMKKHV